jgi:signal transduction histidine kinase
MNLMDNAIKYTPAGKVDVHLEAKNGEIVYRVVDTGRGMLKEDIGKLFKKFSRVGGSALVHTEGTGLGLYIAKQIIMKHNGKIWAESQGEGLGSTFALALKVNNAKLEAELDKQIRAEKALDEEAKAKKDEREFKEDTIDLANKPKIQ